MKRRQIADQGQKAKEHSQLLTRKMFEIGQRIIQVKRNAESFNKSKGDCTVASYVPVWKRVPVGHNVTRCTLCPEDNTAICHTVCECQGCEKDKKRCVVMSDAGYCTKCPHHYSQHENVNYIYEIGEEKKTFEVSALREQYQAGVAKLDNDRVLIFAYVDELVAIAGELEQVQVKIKECNEFL